MMVLTMVLRWWDEDDNSCTGSSAKTSELGPEKLSGIFLLLAIAMALAIVICAIQLLVVFMQGQTNMSK